MMVTVLKPFWDKACSVDRRPGDVFDATESRVAAINAAGFGQLVEAAAQPSEPEPVMEPAPVKPKGRSKGKKA